MFAEHGFLGVPVATFDEGGRRQLMALLREGLSPEHKLLEIGCGCLRTAYWLMRLLDPGGYCGIEPARERVEWGLETLFTPAERVHKRPRFEFNADFDTGVFGERFDFVLAGSIWTHASKAHIETMLDGFARDTRPTGVFLASFLPARTRDEDYRGDAWVGTSHESATPGIVRHAFAWIEGCCKARDLSVEAVPGPAFDDQHWLRVRHAAAPPLAERLAGES